MDVYFLHENLVTSIIEVLTLFHYITHLCKLYLHVAEDLSYICERVDRLQRQKYSHYYY